MHKNVQRGPNSDRIDTAMQSLLLFVVIAIVCRYFTAQSPIDGCGSSNKATVLAS